MRGERGERRRRNTGRKGGLIKQINEHDYFLYQQQIHSSSQSKFHCPPEMNRDPAKQRAWLPKRNSAGRKSHSGFGESQFPTTIDAMGKLLYTVCSLGQEIKKIRLTRSLVMAGMHAEVTWNTER